MTTECIVFDSFVDDLLTEDIELLKGELDLLIMQHLFDSIDLKIIEKYENYQDDNYLAA